MLGDLEGQLALIPREDVEDHTVAKHYVRAVVGTRERLLRRYEQARRGLSGDEARLAQRLGDVDSLLLGLTAQVAPAFDTVVERVRELEAYEAGAQAYIDGFVFPVAGESEFIDSWGYPRMSGTQYAHWHQGTDIFAPHGTPLIAAENGVLARIGVGTLGGNKLWVKGESGNEYYYAHLSAFAPGIADGTRVRAGEVIGYVGDTGNARGTSPHLHFEIHPGGRGPVNPYPLLKAAYGNRPTFRAVAPPPPPPAEPPAPSDPPFPAVQQGG
jgi:murein DD-endopeptidase MepM/ murein hydrolase activator NlpD